MNLLISIMGDSHAEVMENLDVSKLKEVCNIIYEHEYLCNRHSMFENAKYILIAKVQSSDDKKDYQWEGVINNLKQIMKTQIGNLKLDMNEHNDKTKERISKLQDKQEHNYQELKIT